MSLWKKAATPEQINARLLAGPAGHFGIRIIAVEPDAVVAQMTVGPRHLQPHGILHGGVSVVLSETLGSVACFLALPEGLANVGLEINANHLAPVREGETVTATCRPLHTGRTTQVWQTEIRRPDGKLACVSRLTCAVREAGPATAEARRPGTPRTQED
jgi:1,4-dihydroxy-2-naphthoyl-CoA hydrolase